MYWESPPPSDSHYMKGTPRLVALLLDYNEAIIISLKEERFKVQWTRPEFENWGPLNHG